MTRFDHSWFCRFSLRSDEQYAEPEPQIAAMLAIVEALDPTFRSAWAGCSVRMFDIGYDGGREPFFIRQELSTETLARLDGEQAVGDLDVPFQSTIRRQRADLASQRESREPADGPSPG